MKSVSKNGQKIFEIWGIFYGSDAQRGGRGSKFRTPPTPLAVILSLFFCAVTLCSAFYDSQSTQCQATKPKRNKRPQTLSKEAQAESLPAFRGIVIYAVSMVCYSIILFACHFINTCEIWLVLACVTLQVLSRSAHFLNFGLKISISPFLYLR